jgi:hypothetical protein
MQLHVQQFVYQCVVFDWVWVSLDAPSFHLQSLPIIGLGYQWSLDFVGPPSVIVQQNIYFIVTIEHFLKWLELVPLLDHINEIVVYVFFDMVLNKFGVLALVFTN